MMVDLCSRHLLRSCRASYRGCKQAGIQVGNSYWELYCLEHGMLKPDAIAQLVGNVILSTPSLPKLVRGSMSQELYLLILNQLYDEVRTRKYRHLFHPEQLISGKEDAANNFVEGTIPAEWGPIHHIHVIKERRSGISRGFAFIDFPCVGAAQIMMDMFGHEIAPCR
ncbi:Tubulin alpha-3 chain [Orobanche minor]